MEVPRENIIPLDGNELTAPRNRRALPPSPYETCFFFGGARRRSAINFTPARPACRRLRNPGARRARRAPAASGAALPVPRSPRDIPRPIASSAHGHHASAVALPPAARRHPLALTFLSYTP